jgi:DNA-binding IclR family transcriptional regulator
MQQVSSLKKAVDILFSFSRDKASQSVAEIADAVGIPRSSAYRFVVSLRQEGLLERTENGNYTLGLRLLELEGIVHRRLKLENIAIPFIKELSRRTEETVILNMLLNDNVITVYAEESAEALRVAPQRGLILSLNVGASRQVILAYLPQEMQDNVCSNRLKKTTPYTVSDPVQLRQRLAKIRKQGYAISSQEVYIGATGIAAPIFDRDDNVFASIAVIAPTQRLTKKKQSDVLKHILKISKDISQAVIHYSVTR